ncbi:MAG TPA: cytochrome P450 [Thermomicrobiales bacterium]|jgi:cytochrome P450|nr:cytochrome P450 [Thermomicrobiales bacterium]
MVDDERRRGGTDWPVRALFRIPVAVTVALLGLPRSAVDEITPAVRAFARAIAPSPFDGPVADGDAAVRSLTDQLTAGLESAQAVERPGVLHDMATHPALADPGSRDHLIANAIGLLFQSMDATAGLIGNTLGQLSRDPVLRVLATQDPGTLAGVLRETLRYDPPVHTTRRYVASPTRLGDARLAVGDRVVVVLAAGNRDPAVWDEPERFDSARNAAPDPLTFGIGPHRCPGERLAWEITRAGVRAGLRAGLADERFWSPCPRIIPSANARIPEILNRYASSIRVDPAPVSEEPTP